MLSTGYTTAEATRHTDPSRPTRGRTFVHYDTHLGAQIAIHASDAPGTPRLLTTGWHRTRQDLVDDAKHIADVVRSIETLPSYAGPEGDASEYDARRAVPERDRISSSVWYLSAAKRRTIASELVAASERIPDASSWSTMTLTGAYYSRQKRGMRRYNLRRAIDQATDFELHAPRTGREYIYDLSRLNPPVRALAREMYRYLRAQELQGISTDTLSVPQRPFMPLPDLHTAILALVDRGEDAIDVHAVEYPRMTVYRYRHGTGQRTSEARHSGGRA